MRDAKDNLWLDEPYQPGQSLWGTREADVAIVGGGFAGLASAYFIKQRFPEKRVAVLEKEFIGFGSSGRNAGASGGTIGFSASRLQKAFGAERVAVLQKLALEAFLLAESLIEKHNIDCGHERPGLLILARNGKQAERLEREAKATAEIGLETSLLDGREAKSQFGALSATAALTHSAQAVLNPGRFVRGMKIAAESLGVEVYEHSGCTRIEPGREVMLYTPGGRVRARNIVVTTNAYMNPLGLYQSKVLPFYVYNIATEPLTQQQLDDFQWPGRKLVLNVGTFFWIARLTPDNRLVFNNNNALYFYDRSRDYSHRPREYSSHYKLLIKLFPFLKGIRITHEWGGRIGMTLDFLPFIGRTGKHKNIFYGLGFNGHGVAWTQLAGKMIATLMAEEKSYLTDHLMIHRRSWPLPSGSIAYAGVNGYRLLYKMDDWLLGRGK